MHKHLNNLGLAGVAAALILTPAMAAAQAEPATDTASEAGPMVEELTPEQETAMQSWPADRQTAFKLWPADTQAYFWTLPDERQKMFWALSDSDKVALSTMPEQQRESIWAQIEARSAPPRS